MADELGITLELRLAWWAKALIWIESILWCSGVRLPDWSMPFIRDHGVKVRKVCTRRT